MTADWVIMNLQVLCRYFLWRYVYVSLLLHRHFKDTIELVYFPIKQAFFKDRIRQRIIGTQWNGMYFTIWNCYTGCMLNLLVLFMHKIKKREIIVIQYGTMWDLETRKKKNGTKFFFLVMSGMACDQCSTKDEFRFKRISPGVEIWVRFDTTYTHVRVQHTLRCVVEEAQLLFWLSVFCAFKGLTP